MSKNQTAFNSYFKWKEHVIFPNTSYSERPVKRVICDMCIYLRLANYFGIKKSILDDAVDYWDRNKSCTQIKF